MTEPERLSLGECDPVIVARVVNAAVARARRYFRIPEEYETYVYPQPAKDHPENTPLLTVMLNEYLFHEIFIQAGEVHSYALAWKYGGHEVAHLQSRELARMCDDLPGEFSERAREGIEALTTRLDRMFLRDCPYPGDDHFTGGIDHEVESV